MVAKGKINFYLLFRLRELRMHLGFVIACVNDTLMLLLVSWFVSKSTSFDVVGVVGKVDLCPVINATF